MIWADFHVHVGRSRDGAFLGIRGLRKIMRACHIRHAVVFPIDEASPGLSYEHANSRLIRLLKRTPHLAGFMRLDPRAGARALAELERCAGEGLVGVKLHPRSEHFSAQRADFLFPHMVRKRLPVILHTSHEQGCTPREWEPIFRRYRDIPFILAHGGKDCYEEAARLVRRHDHLYIETSTLSYFRTRSILKIAGAEKVLFGSDLPYSHPHLEEQKFALVATPRERRKILADNARRFFQAWLRRQ